MADFNPAKDPGDYLKPHNGGGTTNKPLPTTPDQALGGSKNNSSAESASGYTQVNDQSALEIAFGYKTSAEIVLEVLNAFVLNKRMPNLPGVGANDTDTDTDG